MTDEHRAEALARWEKTTPGIWFIRSVKEWRDDFGTGEVVLEEVDVILTLEPRPNSDIPADCQFRNLGEVHMSTDGEFIAHARTDLPAALDALDAKDAEIAELSRSRAEYARMLGESSTLLAAYAKRIDDLLPSAAFGDHCAEDRREGAMVPASVVKALRDEITELRKDTARLDFWEKHPRAVAFASGYLGEKSGWVYRSPGWAYRAPGTISIDAEDLRGALDGAMTSGWDDGDTK